MKRPLAKAQPHEVLGSIQLLGQRARLISLVLAVSSGLLPLHSS
jgi:hypothetical protein